jgi:cytochrome b561
MNTQLKVLGKRLNMAPRVHRRWLVVAMYAIFAAILEAGWTYDAARGPAWCLLGSVPLVLILVNLVGRSNEAKDERESGRWDHAYARAYPWLGYCLVFALFASGLAKKLAQFSSSTSPALHAFEAQLPYMMVMATGVLYVTLPQAILLWTEPDMEPTD